MLKQLNWTEADGCLIIIKSYRLGLFNLSGLAQLCRLSVILFMNIVYVYVSDLSVTLILCLSFKCFCAWI